MEIHVPENVSNLLMRLNNAGYEAYIVGGCVRDSLLGRTPQDWDIATNAKPDRIKHCFSDCRMIDTGLKHGTITVLLENIPVEVTTYRIDGDYSDCRRPDRVEFTDDLEIDLSRRDFTINAIAYNPEKGIVDYFGGQQNIEEREIVCVGNAHKRFSEDALRILRAVRFSSVLGFSIERDTLSAMKECSGLLDKISVERISSELTKALTGGFIAEALLKYTEIFTKIIPELAPMIDFEQHSPYHHLDVWKHTVETVKAVSPNLVLRMAMLFHDCAKPDTFKLDSCGIGHFYGHAGAGAAIAERALERLRYDNVTRRQVAYLIKHHCDQIMPEPKQLKRMLNRMGEKTLLQLLAVKRADCSGKIRGHDNELDEIQSIINEIISRNQAFCLRDLAVNGNDLLRLGFARDKILGDTLQRLLQLVIDEQLENDHETLLSAAKDFL